MMNATLTINAPKLEIDEWIAMQRVMEQIPGLPEAWARQVIVAARAAH